MYYLLGILTFAGFSYGSDSWPYAVGNANSTNTSVLCDGFNLQGGDLKKPSCHCPSIYGADFLADCSEMQLTSLPAELIVADHVVRLDLSRNRLQFINTTFRGRVRELIFSHNRIATVDMNGFKFLSQLHLLDLSLNKILHISGEIVVDKLDIGHNLLSSVPRELIRHVRTLILRGNPMGTAFESGMFFNDLPALEVLDISNCNITTLSEDLFNKSSIRQLQLGWNPLKSVPTLSLSHLGGTLKHLDISGTHIGCLNAHAFHALFNLQELRIDHMPLVDSIHGFAFSDLRELRMLSIKYNPQLVTIDRMAFRGWSQSVSLESLKKVYLTGNSLTTLRKDVLPWESMEVVDLQRNPWTCNCKLRWTRSIHNATALFGEEFRCSHPEHLSHIRVVEVSQDEFTCSNFASVAKVILLSFLAIAFAMGSLVFIGFAMRAYNCYPNCLCFARRKRQRVAEGYSRITVSRERVDLLWEKQDAGPV